MDSGSVGSLALWGAVAAAGVTLVARLVGARHRVSAAAGLATVGLATVAVGALAWSLLSGNFALAYVADTTTRQGGWPYRLAGLWGGNGGSLLFWAWIILVVGWWATRPLQTVGLARLAVVVAGGSVLLVAASTANPFQRLAIPAIDGGGLNPILQYPAMLYHPPILYAGHAGFVAPFALAIAALATGRLDRAWLESTRRWMLVAWLLLGIGLVAGAHWSYVELGWGGFWAWDPVENAGLLPFLAATAFLHRARLRRGTTGLAALAALPFCLSLLGATISRSGAAQSVHAFAQAGAVGRGLLAVATAAVTTVVLLCAVRRRREPVPLAPVSSQDAALGAAVVLTLAIAGVVAVGIAFPALVHAAGGQRIVVTTRYYAIVVTPLALVAAVLMGIGPSLGAARGAGRMSGWRRLAATPEAPPLAPNAAAAPRNFVGPGAGTPATTTLLVEAPIATAITAARSAHAATTARRRVRWVLAAAAAGIAAGLLARSGGVVPAVLGAGAAFAAVLTAAELLPVKHNSVRRSGALLAHGGMALLLFGVAGSLLGRQSTQVVRTGSTMTVSGYTLRYRDVVADQRPGWQRVTVLLDVTHDSRPVAVLRPDLRVFPGQATALSDVAMRSTPAEDLIVAVRQVDPATHAAELQVTVRPLVTLVWWGGLLAAAGGGIVLVSARRRR